MKVRFIAGGLAAVTAVTAAAPLSVYASSNYSMRKKVIVTAGIVESGILGIIVRLYAGQPRSLHESHRRVAK